MTAPRPETTGSHPLAKEIIAAHEDPSRQDITPGAAGAYSLAVKVDAYHRIAKAVYPAIAFLVIGLTGLGAWLYRVNEALKAIPALEERNAKLAREVRAQQWRDFRLCEESGRNDCVRPDEVR